MTVRIGDSTSHAPFKMTSTPARDIAESSIGTSIDATSFYRGRTARPRLAPPSARSLSSQSSACWPLWLRVHRKSARNTENKRETSTNNSGTWGCEASTGLGCGWDFGWGLDFDLEDFDWDWLFEFDGTERFGVENALESGVTPVFFSILDNKLSKSAFDDMEDVLVEPLEVLELLEPLEPLEPFDAGAGPKLKDRADPEVEEPKSQERPVEITGFAAGFTSSSFTSSSFTATC